MDLPVEEWKSYLLDKWTLLPKTVQDTISTAETLSDVFLRSSCLLQPEDEMFLKQLSSVYLVEKDYDAPLFYREEGNRKFQEKEYTAAAVLYSKGVSHSRPNTEDISLCYANRSAALFRLGQYNACLKDIVRAGMHGYPERLQPKMMLRKTECLLNLGKLQEARQTITDLERSLAAKPTQVPSSHQILQRNLQHLKMKIQEKENLPETFPAALTRAFEDMALGEEENKQISGASPSVSLCTDPLKGRHLVATKDILPGELLVKEDAFVSVLNPGEVPPLHHGLENKWDTRVTNGDLYCHRCLKHTLASVPCGSCSYARYCSQTCAQKAWECYHSTECPLGGLLLTLGVFCHVALRMTLLTRFEDVDKVVRMLCDETCNKDMCLPENKNLVKTFNYTNQGESEESSKIGETPIPGCNINGKYESNYNAVFSLLPHTEKHSPEHKFLCAISVFALCRQLKAASLQAQTISLKPSKLKAVTRGVCADWTIWGVAMLRHMLQLQCNAHAITSIWHTGSKESAVTSSRQVRLATGIFPVVSLLNHSCSPNTSVSFTSTVATIRAAQQIRKGQEIVHCYGPHESWMGVAERRQKLTSQYFFDCSCPACHTEVLRAAAEPRWEAFCCNTCRALMQGAHVLSCSNKSCTESVSRDHLVSRLQDLQQQVCVAQKLLRSGKPEQAVQQLLGCREAAESFLSAEHTVVGEIEDGLAQAYAALGNWQKSATHIQKSICVVEARHGPSSVEIGHELFKLAQVLFNGLAVHEALNAIRKAEKVLLVHCGPESHEVQELREMKSCLLDLSFIPVGPLV